MTHGLEAVGVRNASKAMLLMGIAALAGPSILSQHVALLLARLYLVFTCSINGPIQCKWMGLRRTQ